MTITLKPKNQSTRVLVLKTGTRGATGQPGPPGNGGLTVTTGVPIGGNRVVTLDAANNAIYADAATLAHAGKVIGISTGAAAAGAALTVQSIGPMTEPSWNWTPDSPVYLGLNGVVTQVLPSSPGSKFCLIVGVAQTSTTILINIRDPILL